jgi:hypothetical protein
MNDHIGSSLDADNENRRWRVRQFDSCIDPDHPDPGLASGTAQVWAYGHPTGDSGTLARTTTEQNNAITPMG